MRFILFLAMIALFAGCQSNTRPSETDSKQSNVEEQSTETDYQVAERFLNEYVVLESDDVEQWIQQHILLTNSFKATYLNIMEAARKEDPEIGLGFDPILNGQDFPSTFTIADIDSTTGYVTLKGVEWADFLLVVRVVKQNETSLLDGAGIVNIPEEVRK
ncbi:hypothetical protein SAMN05660206_12022 [Sphingobacterium wenxiniae]|uniref:Uncharacterized protein n=2 Tax=Sphingobacterium wenxiniae TaxID=683125 RepID=A0A1I6VYV7_9SPHI|nr:hypothetical protein SAMN05660206_12022 [Sphingobacterium wenxiniae]